MALLNAGMNCPHPQPFSLRRRELALLFPLHLGEGEGEGGFGCSYFYSATPNLEAFLKLATWLRRTKNNS